MTIDPSPLHFVIVVLGDVGRSPRMQYHALSLLKAGHHVSLVGYCGERLIHQLEVAASAADASKQLSVIRFRVPSPKIFQKVKPFYFIWRIFSLALWLSFALFIRVRRGKKLPVDCVLVQNPPALPLLAVAYLYCSLQASVIFQRKRPAYVVDWHNLGYSMLSPGGFRKLARIYEARMAPLADGHLTVTQAMKDFLVSEMDETFEPSKCTVLYDCPPSVFRPLDTSVQHNLLMKIHSKLCEACPRSWYDQLDAKTQTLFTERTSANTYIPRKGRPALVTSSTSWTSDEDFGILLAALILLDELITNSKKPLKVMIVVTGKGPQKTYYLEKISKLAMQNVAVQTLWLEPSDYSKLLACADLGVSLHTSTSGLDLPMKILDLYGCHVPVCAYKFKCLDELVQDGVNGRVFESPSELANQLWILLQPLSNGSNFMAPHSFGPLLDYSKNAASHPRWEDTWTAHAWPVLAAAIQKHAKAR